MFFCSSISGGSMPQAPRSLLCFHLPCRGQCWHLLPTLMRHGCTQLWVSCNVAAMVSKGVSEFQEAWMDSPASLVAFCAQPLWAAYAQMGSAGVSGVGDWRAHQAHRVFLSCSELAERHVPPIFEGADCESAVGSPSWCLRSTPGALHRPGWR